MAEGCIDKTKCNPSKREKWVRAGARDARTVVGQEGQKFGKGHLH